MAERTTELTVQSGIPDGPRTPPELAADWGCNPETIRLHIAAGNLAAADVSRPGSTRPRYLIMPEAVEEFFRRRSTRQAAAYSRRRRQTEWEAELNELLDEEC